MLLALLSLLTALTISGVAIYYSVIGLTAIFSAAAIPIMIMGVALEVAKLVATVWLHRNWKSSPFLIKTYLTISVVVLMLITSMGIFGFLSKAHNDQNLVSGDVLARIAIYDEKIKTAKDNIEASRKQLKQMDEAVDQIMSRSTDEKGADKANAVRKSQLKDRANIAKDIEANQKLIAKLNEERAPIAAEVRKVEAEVGPIKYIAAFFYGNTDTNILERAVTWVIMTIIFVFDPLAVVLLLASQYSFKEYFHNKKGSKMREFFEHDEEKAEGDSPVKEPDVVSNSTVTEPEPVGFVAQEISEVLPEAVTIDEPKPKVDLIFSKMNTEIKGFDIPKVNVTHDVEGIIPLKIDTETLAIKEMKSDELELEQWNKMIEAAEKEVSKSEVSPEEEQILNAIPSVEVVEKHENGLYDNRDLINDPKYKIFPELIEKAQANSELYVQNEEQTESALWSMSQQDYQAKVKEASVRELVRWLEEGHIKIEDLSDDEARQVEEYLNKEKDDRQDNADKSA